jgi:hypothetical protein
MPEALAIVNKLLHEDMDDPAQYLDWLGRKEEIGGLENVGIGILIYTSPEDLIEQNAQEDGITTDQAFWDKINDDVTKIERNALTVLNDAGITISSEGHDGHTQALAATGWLMQKNNYDEDKRPDLVKFILNSMEYEAPSTSSGTMHNMMPGATEKLYQGVSEIGYLIDVTIEFFGNELKEWAALNLNLNEGIDVDTPEGYLDKTTGWIDELIQMGFQVERHSRPGTYIKSFTNGDYIYYVLIRTHMPSLQIWEEFRRGNWLTRTNHPDFRYLFGFQRRDKSGLLALTRDINQRLENFVAASPPALLKTIFLFKLHVENLYKAHPGRKANRLGEAVDDADPITYLNQIHDYDDLARGIMNYGLFVQRTLHWGRWIIMTGAAYWAVNNKTQEPLTSEFFERQLERFAADLGITQFHFKVSPPDAKGHIYYQLAIPKSQINWESWQRFANDLKSSAESAVAAWLPEAIEPFRQPDDISCGPSVIHMLNRALGQTNRSFEQIGKLTHTNRVWGSLPVFMTSALRKLGLPFEKRRITTAEQLAKEMEGAVCAMLIVYEGIPHWILVTGLEAGNFTVNDPAEGAVVYDQARMAAALDRSTLSGIYRAVGFMIGTAYRLTGNVNEAIDPDDPAVNIERHTAGLDVNAVLARLGFTKQDQSKPGGWDLWTKTVGNQQWRVWPSTMTNIYGVTRLERPAKFVQVGRGKRYGQWSDKGHSLCHVTELEQQLQEEGALTEALDPDAPEPAIERFAQDTEQSDLKLEATITAAILRYEREVEQRDLEHHFNAINLADNLAAEIGNEMAEKAGYPNGTDEFDYVVSAVNSRAGEMFPDPDTLEADEPPPVQEDLDVDPEAYIKSLPLEVLARITNDDTQDSVRFDCAAWFKQASLKQLLAVAKENWQYGDACDEVARFFSDTVLDDFFREIQEKSNGYGVRISIEDARRWIEFNRPDWLQYFHPEDMHPLREATDPDDPSVNVDRHMASMDAGKILTDLGFDEWWPSWDCADPTYMGWQKWNRGLKWYVTRKSEDEPQMFEVSLSKMRVIPVSPAVNLRGMPLHDYEAIGGFTCHVGELKDRLTKALQQPQTISYQPLEEATDPDDPSINIDRHTADLDLEAILTKLGFAHNEKDKAWHLDKGCRRVIVWPTEVPQIVTVSVGEMNPAYGSNWHYIEMDRGNLHITKLPTRLRSRGLVNESQNDETVDYPAVWVTGRIFIGPSHYHIVSQLEGNGVDVSAAQHGWWTSHSRFLDSDSDLNDLIELDPRFGERSGEDPGVKGEELPKAKQLTGVRQVHEGLEQQQELPLNKVPPAPKQPAVPVPDPDDPEMVLTAHKEGQIVPELERLQFKKTRSEKTMTVHDEIGIPYFWFKVMEAHGHQHAFHVLFHDNGFEVDVWDEALGKWHQGHPRLDAHPKTAGHAALILRDLYAALIESTEANLSLEQERELLRKRLEHHNQWYHDLAKSLSNLKGTVGPGQPA